MGTINTTIFPIFSSVSALVGTRMGKSVASEGGGYQQFPTPDFNGSLMLVR